MGYYKDLSIMEHNGDLLSFEEWIEEQIERLKAEYETYCREQYEQL